MVDRFYEERAALAEYQDKWSKFTVPSDPEMRALRDLAGVLWPLAEATDLLQGDSGRSPLAMYLPVVHQCIRAMRAAREVLVDAGDGENLAHRFVPGRDGGGPSPVGMEADLIPAGTEVGFHL